MDIKWLPISKVKTYERNPRKNDHAVDAVVESLTNFGWKQPIVIDKDNVIIVGHTRVKAARKMKLDKVPCIMADDLTEDQVRAYRIADNKVGEIADWDIDLLKFELGEIEMDMTVFGLDITEHKDTEIIEDNFIPEPPIESKSKLGDIYQLGNHRLMCGDATNPEHMQNLIGSSDTLADLLLTDPPYNVDYTGKTDKALTIQNDKMSDDKFNTFLNTSFNITGRHIKQGGSYYIFHADSKGEWFREATRTQLGQVRQTLIWKKNHFVIGRQDYQWIHEPIIYGWKDGAPHYFIDDRTQSTILEYDKPLRNEEHPTMKPVQLIAKLIENSTRQAEIVLDPFGGSGTTLIASEQINRKCYTMELDPRYVDVIINRWEEFTGKTAIKLEGVNE